MEEFDFIRRCTDSLPSQAEGLLCGIGDDCAVITGSAGRDWLISTDGYVEGVHFRLGWMTAREIGGRCLVAAVSDIAAMGGRPRYVTISIAVSPTISGKDAMEVMEGIAAAAASHQMVVIGGDTTAAQHGLQIVLTVIGDIRHGAALYRRGARPGDVVYVTGQLGGALTGLQELKKIPSPLGGGLGRGGGSSEVPPTSISRFLHPVARIASGQWLADTGCVTSMIDISDGLVQDLGHMADASGVGIVLNADAIPRWNDNGTMVDLQVACVSGEEYELAFTIDGRRDAPFQRLLPAALGQLGHSITRIGTVVAGSGVMVHDAGGRDLTPSLGGFCHVIGKKA